MKVKQIYLRYPAPQLENILWAFMLNRKLSMEGLITWLWPDPEDEPEWPEEVVYTQISNLRKRLTPSGWTIANHYKRGWTLDRVSEVG